MTLCHGESLQKIRLAVSLIAAATLCSIVLLGFLKYKLRASQDDAYGRSFLDHHSPRCCFTDDCLGATREGVLARTGAFYAKHAFVTSLRSPEYLVLLRDLQCSLSATNPGVPLVVLAVEGELSSDIVAEVDSFALYREVPNIEFATNEPRFSKNWFKMNAWNFTQYESLILLDSDMVVLGNLRHVFELPTDFAWTFLNAPNGYAYNVGGFIMLRPCAAVFSHMLQLVQQDDTKRYRTKFAEQSFFAWYFAYTGFRLPMAYNANFQYIVNGSTIGGTKPFVVHFATVKPFQASEGDPFWKYLCFRYQIHHHQTSEHFLPGHM